MKINFYIIRKYVTIQSERVLLLEGMYVTIQYEDSLSYNWKILKWII